VTEGSIVHLADRRATDSNLCGNKAARIADLFRRGYRVPAGFCVTTAMGSTGEARCDLDWESEVVEALTGLASPWAVRSSSTAEDADQLAFAGVFKTVLGVSDPRAVIDAIRLVRDSLHSDVAQHYARNHGVDIRSARMGVMVQTLVDAVASGVAFGRHPVTGADVVAIEANYGLGETVVDGSVIPDLLLVHRDGSVTLDRVGTKRAKVVASRNGVSRVPTSQSEQQHCALGPECAEELARVVRELETTFGGPQDVEWAVSADGLTILQTRPITSLKPSQQKEGGS
jgi:phosphoenolpyruvate synthase/pyruvate phosphate dikinase